MKKFSVKFIDKHNKFNPNERNVTVQAYDEFTAKDIVYYEFKGLDKKGILNDKIEILSAVEVKNEIAEDER